MKYVIAKEHLDFFRKHNTLELEGLFSENHIKQLSKAIEDVLVERLKVTPSQAMLLSPYQHYVVGRDVWRHNSFIAKTVKNRTIVETMALLTGQREFRIGYDQYFPPLAKTSSKFDERYDTIVNRKKCIEPISCLQGIIGGAIIALHPSLNTGAKTNAAESNSFPAQAGNVVFFGTEKEIDFTELMHQSNNSYLMIAYAEPNAVYVFREEDPNTHTLKEIGYRLSDRLKDKFHPMVYRS